MALTDSMKSSNLFKQKMGVSETRTARDFFEEPFLSRQTVLPTQVWNQADLIPAVAPVGMTNGQTIGVVQRLIDRTMTAVPGTTNAFYLADAVDVIPFNWDSAGSYNYTVKSSTDASIAFGLGDWILDTNSGVLSFYGTVPPNMPPKISFYKYVGTKGVGGASNSSENVSWNATFTLHEFSLMQPVFFYPTSGSWEGAATTDLGNSATHLITKIIDENTVEIGQVGKFTIPGHGFTTGKWYRSNSAWTKIEPDTISNPVFFAIAPDTIYLYDYRAIQKPGTIEAINTSGTFFTGDRFFKLAGYQTTIHGTTDIYLPKVVPIASVNDIPLGYCIGGLGDNSSKLLVNQSKINVPSYLDISGTNEGDPVYFTADGQLSLIQTGSVNVGVVGKIVDNLLYIDVLSNVASSSKTYNRVEVDELPMSSYFSGGGISSPLPKWFLNLGNYFGLFLFEFTQEGTSIAKDLFFNSFLEMTDWMDTNLTGGQVTIRCYYYEDISTNSMSRVAGRNFAYSILKSGRYFSTSFSTFGHAYNECKWNNKNSFIVDLLQNILGVTTHDAYEDVARCIWFPRNQKKIYKHHRDDYRTVIDQEFSTVGKYCFDLSGTLYPLSDLTDKTFEIVGSRFINFTRNGPGGPATYYINALSENRKRPSEYINGADSLLKVYTLQNPDTGYYAFYIKPVGVDSFYGSGFNNNILNVIGVSEGKNTQTQYFNTGADINVYSGNDIGCFFTKFNISNFLAKGVGYRSPSSDLLKKVSVIYNYGDGYFSKRSNIIRLKAYETGVALQITV